MLLSTSSLASCSCMGGPELQKFTHSPADPHNQRCCRRHPSLWRLPRTAASAARLQAPASPSHGLSNGTWRLPTHSSETGPLPPQTSSSIHHLRMTCNCRGLAHAPRPGSARPPRPLLEMPKAHSGLNLDSGTQPPNTRTPHAVASSPRRGTALTAPSNAAAICKPQSTFSASLLITVSTTWDSPVYGLTPPPLSFLLEYELRGARILLFTATTQQSSRHVLEL